jgi:hypothetical protein
MYWDEDALSSINKHSTAPEAEPCYDLSLQKAQPMPTYVAVKDHVRISWLARKHVVDIVKVLKHNERKAVLLPNLLDLRLRRCEGLSHTHTID